MIGERLKRLRKSRGITQRELAEILNIEKSNISLYEANKSEPPDNIKVAIAKYFNTSLDYILGVIDEEIEYYDERLFVKLPDFILDEQKKFIREYIQFVGFDPSTYRDREQP